MLNKNQINFLIVVPTLNSYVLLEFLVASLKNQTYQKWRVVFIDGNSIEEHKLWLEECCKEDKRFEWIPQGKNNIGIFGAMNQGFDIAKNDEWLMFWGSDDWAPSNDSLKKLNELIIGSNFPPDLVTGVGKYINQYNKNDKRKTKFVSREGYLNASDLRRNLFIGKSMPHQPTILSPNVRKYNHRFKSKKFFIAADLDYFIQLSYLNKLTIKMIDFEIVYMYDQGISSRRPFKRLKEVIRIYIDHFNLLFFIPFILRYSLRFYSLIFK